MSDSFADLWNSSAPSKPAAAPKTLGGSLASVQPNGSGRKNDVFSMLASGSGSSSSSTLGSRTGSPAYASNLGSSSRPASAQQQGQSDVASRNNGTGGKGGGGDAFSGLGGFNSTRSPTANMSMAERQKLQQQQALNAYASSSLQQQQNDSAWAGLDSLGSGPQPTPPPPVIATGSFDDDDWGLGADFSGKPTQEESSQPKPSSSSRPPVDDDGWGGLERGIGLRSGSLLGLDDDEGDNGLSSLPPSRQQQRSRPSPKPSAQAPPKNLWDLDDFTSAPSRREDTDSPSQNFDFGSREDGDDILGDLSRPVSSSPRPPPRPRERQEQPPSNRSRSPPPHLLGQLVEMGFPVQEAKLALASTEGGADVEAAVAILSSSSEPKERPRQPSRRRTGAPRDSPDYERARGERRSRQDDNSSPASLVNGIQTEQIIAQASVLGKTFLTRANAVWKESKERAQKMYDDYNEQQQGQQQQQQRQTPTRTGSSQSGRPKWMTEEFKDEEEEERQAKTPKSAFRDDDVRDEQASRAAQSAPPAAPPPEPEPEVDLFAPVPAQAAAAAPSSEPKVYQSRFRNAQQQPSSRSSTARPASTPARPSVQATPSQASSSDAHKQRGNASFKLGQYGEAESAYTLAIGALPTGCWALLVSLHNNRALARLKNGDYKGAEADASIVIDDAGLGDSEEDKKKALRRRAEALEGREKWADARRDWERVGDAVGVGRCRKMLDPKPTSTPAPARPSATSGSSSSSVPARTVPARPRPPVQQSGEALKKLQAQNEAASNEDTERFKLKDVVDGALSRWKQGKENNIRGLLASLHSDLGLGEEGVGMKDLITEKQLKIRYTKAIARVHPDKMNERNSTLQQRMIANGVFGTLNEAWNAFKP